MLVCLGLLCACDGSDSNKGPDRIPTGLNDAPWPMHPIANRFRGANALSPGDVNKDGFADYITNYEFDQRYVIALHPGAGGDVKAPWPMVVAWKPEPLVNGNGVNPEHSALGDFDGDDNLDVVAAQGWSNLAFWDGSQPGVRLVWGPPPTEVLDEGAWTDAGRIPGTIDRGHLIFVVPFDVNGDGATDIVSGGRVHGGNGRKGGVIWIEAPADPADRRNLAQWQIHDIDPNQFSAHGLVLTDIDMDGDKDIALANADWDTPEEEENVLWYENPGTGSEAQKDPWTPHLIYQGSEFFAKPQIAAADLNGDGLSDLLVQADRDIYYFKKTGIAPVNWQRIVISKDPIAQRLARPIRVVDINGDGRLDIVGMLIHEEGTLPGDKAAAFWMEYSGDEPLADNWTTHVIKWGSGKTMLLPIFGEKWDQVNFADVDRDGDLDVIANCEEWWEDDIEFRFFFDPKVDPNSVAVVWFENRLHEEPYAFEERNGLCVIDPEHHTELKDGTWIERTRYSDYSGEGFVQDHNALIGEARDWNESEGLEYAVHLKGGAYHLWLRRWTPVEWGCLFCNLGGADSNSAWLGVNGEPLADAFDNEDHGFDQWTWVEVPVPVQLSPGKHIVNLRVREGGYAADRILLTTDADFIPSGLGPRETLRNR